MGKLVRPRSSGRVLSSLALTVALAACGTTVVTPAPPTASSGAPPATGSTATAPSAISPATTDSTPAQAASGAAASAAAAGHLSLVAIGDSMTQGEAASCPGCTDFVDLYGKALGAATGMAVDVDNRSPIELSALPPVEATQLLNDILTDPSLRSALAHADVIVVNVGFNDTPWNRFDDPCGASNQTATVVDWRRITPACIERVAGDYKQTLDEILTQVNELRGCARPPDLPPDFCATAGRKNTLLRLTTLYDDWIGEADTPAAALEPTEEADRAFVAAQCWVVREHGGDCADVYHALNGKDGAHDAAPFLVQDHTHFNQAGHQRIADLLAQLGFAPFAP